MITEKIKPIIKGIIKKILIHRKFSASTSGSDSGHYCYSVWLRHLIHAHKAGYQVRGSTIAELGPGDSLGIGLAALISGANKYYAMDVYKYWDIERNLRIFDNIVELFTKKMPIPDQSEFPKVFPVLDDYSFPGYILTDELLQEMLAPERIKMLREELLHIDSGNNIHIRYFIPWDQLENIDHGTVDYFFSQAVLEYVDDLERSYRKFNKWLKRGGLMTHCIDFSAHGITPTWNGHWTFSDAEWKLAHGNNQILLNRAPKSEHIRLMEKNYFSILGSKDKIIETRIGPHHFHKKYAHLTKEDSITFASFIIAQKNENWHD
jgi:hypothetical protein